MKNIAGGSRSRGLPRNGAPGCTNIPAGRFCVSGMRDLKLMRQIGSFKDTPCYAIAERIVPVCRSKAVTAPSGMIAKRAHRLMAVRTHQWQSGVVVHGQVMVATQHKRPGRTVDDRRGTGLAAEKRSSYDPNYVLSKTSTSADLDRQERGRSPILRSKLLFPKCNCSGIVLLTHGALRRLRVTNTPSRSLQLKSPLESQLHEYTRFARAAGLRNLAETQKCFRKAR